ncbi:MAG: histidine--tRNA ligase [Planctomycetota bacterium]
MSDTSVSTKPPSGMRDYLPDELARRRYVIDVIREAYESHGFVPLETPAIENLSTLLGKYGEEGDQLIYRLLHRRDAFRRAVATAAHEGRPAREAELADLGLRYDLTVPLARVVAEYRDLPKYFKRYQIQPVWRADRPGKGRYREFFQCDVDITGTASLVADVEVCSAVASVLDRLGFAGYRIRLNHRELLRALIRAVGIADGLEEMALVAVDKLDKIGREGVCAELAERGVPAAPSARLLDLMVVTAGEGNDIVLEHLRAATLDDRGCAAIAQLAEMLELARETPAGPRLLVSPDLARGLSYYTGPIFEVAVPDLAGSLGGGGRYDNLVGMFGKVQVPAVGFSLGLERLLVVMQERGMFPELSAGPEMLLCWMDVDRARVLGVATRLRASGLRVEVYPDKAKLGKQLQYADAPGVRAPIAGILGADEIAAGEITLKRLSSGEQRRVPMEDVAATLRQWRTS